MNYVRKLDIAIMSLVYGLLFTDIYLLKFFGMTIFGRDVGDEKSKVGTCVKNQQYYISLSIPADYS